MIKPNIKLLCILLPFIISCNPNPKEEKCEPLTLSAHEHKLLLDSSKFEDMENAFEEYWEIVKDVATESGFKVVESENKFEQTQRLVSFFDTKNLDLNQKGYVIRKRSDIKNGQIDSLFKLTIKFKSQELDIAACTKLPFGDGYTPKDAELELEADFINGSKSDDKPSVNYSVGNSVMIHELPGKTLADLSNIFTPLKSLDVDLTEEILPVNGIEAKSYVVNPGTIDFGSGIVAEADISVWNINGKIIAEFSFDHSMSDWENKLDKSVKGCEEFINHLQEKAPEWYVDGKSKSSFIFNK